MKSDFYKSNTISWRTFKKSNCRKKAGKYHLQVILKLEKVKTSLSPVNRIWQMVVIKGTLNRKVLSGSPKASTIKMVHRLKMIVFKENF